MISGKQVTEKKSWTGLCDFEVLGFNPTVDQISKWTGWEEPREPTYVGEDRDGNVQLRVDVWLRSKVELKGQKLVTRACYFVSDVERNQSATGKYQYINNKAQTTWVPVGDEVSNLPPDRRKYFDIDLSPRRTMVGEEDIYTFVLAWTKINNNDSGSNVHIDTPWSELVGGDLSVLNELVGSFSGVRFLLGVKESEGRLFQDIYSRGPLREESTKVKRLKDQVTGDYPWKSDFQDSFALQEYDESSSVEPSSNGSVGKEEVNQMLDAV